MDGNPQSNGETNVFNNREINELYHEIEDLFESLSKNLVTQKYNNDSKDNNNCEENLPEDDNLKKLLIEREQEKRNLLLCSAKLEEAKALLEAREPSQKVARQGVAWEIDEISLARLSLKWGVEKQQNIIRTRLGQLGELSLSDYYRLNKSQLSNSNNNDYNHGNNNKNYNNANGKLVTNVNNNRGNNNCNVNNNGNSKLVNNHGSNNNNNQANNNYNNGNNCVNNGGSNLVYVRGNLKFNRQSNLTNYNNGYISNNSKVNNNNSSNNTNNSNNNSNKNSNTYVNKDRSNLTDKSRDNTHMKSELREEAANGEEENYYQFDSYDDLLKFQTDEYFSDLTGPLPNLYYESCSVTGDGPFEVRVSERENLLELGDKVLAKQRGEKLGGGREKKGKKKECRHYYYYKICNNRLNNNGAKDACNYDHKGKGDHDRSHAHNDHSSADHDRHKPKAAAVKSEPAEENGNGEEPSRRHEHRRNCRKRHKKKCLHGLAGQFASCGLQGSEGANSRPSQEGGKLAGNSCCFQRKKQSDALSEGSSGEPENGAAARRPSTLYKMRVIYPNP